MCLLGDFLQNLYEFLTKTSNIPPNNIVRKHTKKLQQLGDLSFPVTLQNWCQLVNVDRENLQLLTIFDYALGKNSIDWQIQQLINTSRKWKIQIDNVQIRNDDVYLFLNQQSVFNFCIKTVMETRENFGGLDKYFNRLITIEIDKDINDKEDLNLTELRAIILKNTTGNILKYLTINEAEPDGIIKITLRSNNKSNNHILCANVLNENGSKDTETTANNLYKKRSVEIQLMAQHKYGIRLNTNLRDYFDKLSRYCVILELLQNRPQKSIKLVTQNKSPCFIFYNCARLSALLNEFNNKINSGIYPELPPIEQIDFNQLKQPEEWEILFVYILQLPLLIKSCVVDIKNGVINPHYLVVYLANLSSIFSVYYRRIKILIIPKDHLFATLFARIYLLKSLQFVFYTVLNLLDIEPIKEM